MPQQYIDIFSDICTPLLVQFSLQSIVSFAWINGIDVIGNFRDFVINLDNDNIKQNMVIVKFVGRDTLIKNSMLEFQFTDSGFDQFVEAAVVVADNRTSFLKENTKYKRPALSFSEFMKMRIGDYELIKFAILECEKTATAAGYSTKMTSTINTKIAILEEAVKRMDVFYPYPFFLAKINASGVSKADLQSMGINDSIILNQVKKKGKIVHVGPIFIDATPLSTYRKLVGGDATHPQWTFLKYALLNIVKKDLLRTEAYVLQFRLFDSDSPTACFGNNMIVYAENIKTTCVITTTATPKIFEKEFKELLKPTNLTINYVIDITKTFVTDVIIRNTVIVNKTPTNEIDTIMKLFDNTTDYSTAKNADFTYNMEYKDTILPIIMKSSGITS